MNLSRSDTLGGLKHAIEGRIQALANVHTLFYESHWKGADLANVAKHELAPYLQDGVARVRIDGPYILLEPTTAQAMAVILHELATNAAKYGALSDTHGRVEFNWSHKPDGQLMLRWMERDGPKIATPKRKGFGARVINQMVKHQLKGEVRLDWRAEGLTCEIAFPIVDQTFSHESREAIDPAGLGVFQPKHAGAVSPLPGSQ
ncbi:MAG TPA: sensor histidine kinase [Pirellulales bacterium]|nr:sensor histidine kinase [Pirellulales bacterium]